MCNNHQETFTHIWFCPQNQSKIAHIILNSRKQLLTLVKQNTTHHFGYHDLDHDSIWSHENHETKLTFIDIIKGIVPKFLFDQINIAVKDNLVTRRIIHAFTEKIYKDAMKHVWYPRCEVMILHEKTLNISNRIKKAKYTNRNRPSIISRSINLEHVQKGLKGTIFSLNYG